MTRGRSWSADRVPVEMGGGSQEWSGKGAGRRRAGKRAGGRKQLSARLEQNHAESRNMRSPR